MKKLLVFHLLLFVALSTALRAQNKFSLDHHIDSIFEKGYSSTNPDTLANYARRIRQLAGLNSSAKGFAKADLLTAHSFTRSMHYDSAIFHADKCEKLFNLDGILPDIELLGRTLLLKSIIRFQEGKTVLAKQYAENAYTLFLQNKNAHGQANVIYIFATLSQAEGKLEKALSFALRCLSLRMEIGESPELMVRSLQQITNLYNALNQTENTFRYARRVIGLLKKHKMKMLAFPYNAIALAHGNSGNLDSAIYYYRLGLNAADSSGMQLAAYSSINGLAHVLATKGQYRESNNLLDRVLQRFPNLPPTAKISSLLFKAKNYYNLKKYDSALIIVWSFKHFIQQANFRNHGIDAYLTLSNVHEKRGRLDSAVFYTNEAAILIDSVNHYSQQDKIGKLFAEFETIEQQKEIRNLQHDQEIHKARNLYLWMLSIFIAVVSILLTAGIVLYTKVRQRKRTLENHSLTHQVQERRNSLQRQVLRMLYMNNSLSDIFRQLKKLKLDSIGDREILTRIDIDHEWETFDRIFRESYPHFSEVLKSKSFSLTAGDIRLAALIKMDFTNREIAGILSMEVNSVATAKNRLKKKLNLDEDADIHSFLQHAGASTSIETSTSKPGRRLLQFLNF